MYFCSGGMRGNFEKTRNCWVIEGWSREAGRRLCKDDVDCKTVNNITLSLFQCLLFSVPSQKDFSTASQLGHCGLTKRTVGPASAVCGSE